MFSANKSGLLFYLLAFSVAAESTCIEEPVAGWVQVAYYEDDGYRPVTAEEYSESSADDEQNETSEESSKHWRPEQQDKDCQQSSLTQSEDRGYRPLNYGSTRKGSSQQGYEQSYMHDWRPGYPGYYPPYGTPVYPGGAGNIWTQGGYPRFNAPPFLPGYGVMPYSFGSGVPTP